MCFETSPHSPTDFGSFLDEIKCIGVLITAEERFVRFVRDSDVKWQEAVMSYVTEGRAFGISFYRRGDGIREAHLGYVLSEYGFSRKQTCEFFANLRLSPDKALWDETVSFG